MDELYVLARRVLLDALEALGAHSDATILVGAQAIYLHTGDAELAVAEYTTDADLALDPDLLEEISPIEQAQQDAGFVHLGTSEVGIWKTSRARANDKDALDVLRILQCIETAELAARIRRICEDARSSAVGDRGIELLEELFGTRGKEGAVMAARATQP